MRIELILGKTTPFIAVSILLCLLFNPQDGFTQTQDPQLNRPWTLSYLELGTDSFERGFYKSKLSFHFPIKPVSFYIDMTYLQRLNSRWRGELDFWLRAGFKLRLFPDILYEGQVNHMCRHRTSYGKSVGNLDLNEFIAKIWLEKPDFRLGIGAGIYRGLYRKNENLLVFNAEFPGLFKTGISIMAEFKFAGIEELIHDFEISYAMNPGWDLFIRNSKHYGFKNRTFVGTRIKTGDGSDKYINYLNLKLVVYPDDDEYKMLFTNHFRLEFLRAQKSRILLLMNAYIPVKKNIPFFGKFYPERIDYPLSVQYERRLKEALFLFGYLTYELSMPFDIVKEADTNLGAGLGLRNIPHFLRLEKKLRYEVQAGFNFEHDYDCELRVGINTVEKIIDVGSEIDFQLNPDLREGTAVIFGEFGKGLSIRTFVGVRGSRWVKVQSTVNWKFMFGVDFQKWF